jgi:alkylated DNA nucleotide flippase Atl1
MASWDPWPGNRRAAGEGGTMMDADRVQTEIQRIINDDPTISEAKHIIVTVERRGLLRKEVVVLKGKVHADIERTKAEKIAALHAGDREIVDDIVVVH